MPELILSFIINCSLFLMVLLKISILLAAVRIIVIIIKKRNPLLRMWLIRFSFIGIAIIAASSFAGFKINLPVQNEMKSMAPENLIADIALVQSSQNSAASTKKNNLEIKTPHEISRSSFLKNESESDKYFPAAKNVSAAAESSVEQNKTQSIFNPEELIKKNLVILLSAFWALGAVLIFAKRAILIIEVKRLIYKADSPSYQIKNLLFQIASESNIAAMPRLLVSDKIQIPTLAGILKTIIIIPDKMAENPDEEELKTAFIHEIVHYKNRDIFWKFIIEIFSGVLWFHPFIWGISSMHSDACEESADAAAADFIGDAENYTKILARIALSASKGDKIFGIPFAREADVLRRIKMLRLKVFKSKLSLKFSVIASVVFLSIIILFSAIVPVYAESAKEKDLKIKQLQEENQNLRTKISSLENELAKKEQSAKIQAEQNSHSNSSSQEKIYTDEEIKTKGVAYFYSKFGNTDPGYHGFAALWALNKLAKDGDEKTRNEIVEIGISKIKDKITNMDFPWLYCYVLDGVNDQRCVDIISRVLKENPNVTVRGVAACALGDMELESAKAALMEAKAAEKDKTVLDWIEKSLNKQPLNAEQNKSSRTEDEISKDRDAASQSGDILKACEFEMERVMLRKKKNNPWKDKIDLNQIYLDWANNKKPSEAEKKEQLNKISAAVLNLPNPDESLWRYYYLMSGIALDLRDNKSAAEYMDKALESYPAAKYSDPSKHSKYQHLVNERAGLIWNEQGVEAAENFIVEKYRTDPKFEYFFDSYWQSEYEKRNIKNRFENLKNKIAEVGKNKR